MGGDRREGPSTPRLRASGELAITLHVVTDPGQFEKMCLVNYLPFLLSLEK